MRHEKALLAVRKTKRGGAIAGANAIAGVSGASCQRLKPGLTASEACHRLALIEGQKENKKKEEEWRSEGGCEDGGQKNEIGGSFTIAAAHAHQYPPYNSVM